MRLFAISYHHHSSSEVCNPVLIHFYSKQLGHGRICFLTGSSWLIKTWHTCVVTFVNDMTYSKINRLTEHGDKWIDILINDCRKITNIRCTKSQTWNGSRLSCSCFCCPIHRSQVLSREWRCSWSSADRRCSNYIWVINTFITSQCAAYIRGLTVVFFVCLFGVCMAGWVCTRKTLDMLAWKAAT